MRSRFEINGIKPEIFPNEKSPPTVRGDFSLRISGYWHFGIAYGVKGQNKDAFRNAPSVRRIEPETEFH
jgi:hypothetical protein